METGGGGEEGGVDSVRGAKWLSNISRSAGLQADGCGQSQR